MGSILDLSLTLCVSVVCLSCGRALLRRFKFSFQNYSEELVLAGGVGLGLLITGFTLAGIVHQLNRTSLFLILLIFVLIGKGEWSWWARMPAVGIQRIRVDMPWRLFSIALLTCWVLYTMVALSPTLEGDSLAGYLLTAREFVWQGGIVAPDFIYTASFPGNGALLTSVGFLIRGQILGQLIGVWLPGVLAALTIYSLGRSWISPAVGITAASLWSGTYTVGYLLTSGKIDLSWTAFDLLAILAFSRWFFADSEESKPKWLLLSGALLGVAAGTKQASFLTAALLTAGMLWKLQQSNVSVRRGLSTIACFGLPVLPSLFWVVRAYLLTGEPFFAGGELRNESGFWPFFETLWQMSMEGNVQTELEGPLGKSVGPVFLAILPFLILFRRFDHRLLSLLLFSGGMLILWYQTVQRPRHLLPTLGLLAILSACALFHLFRQKPGTGRVLILACIGSLALNLGIWGYVNFASFSRIPFVVGRQDLDQYLQANLSVTRWYPSYEITRFVRGKLPVGAQIAALTPASNNLGSPTHSFYLERPLHGYFTQSPTEAPEAQGFLEILRRAGMSHVLIYDSALDDGELAGAWLVQEEFQEAYLELLLRDNGQSLYEIQFSRSAGFR